MVFKSLCILVLWMKVASALEGLTILTGIVAKVALSRGLVSLISHGAALTNLTSDWWAPNGGIMVLWNRMREIRIYLQ